MERRTDSSSPAPLARTSAPLPVPAVPSAADAAADPAAALSRYLAFESFRGAPEGADSLASCPPHVATGDEEVAEGWEPDRYVGAVLPQVIGTPLVREDSTGTSAIGRASVVRVAELSRDGAGWIGTLAQMLDTLSFTLERTARGWTVCGPALEPLGGTAERSPVFLITYADAMRTEVNAARWTAPGTTWESVARHADSLVSATRLRAPAPNAASPRSGPSTSRTPSSSGRGGATSP